MNHTNISRRYDIDALRVMAFSILIVYHVAMFYVENWGWHIKSEYQYDWVKFPMLLVNQWRMPLLFLVSGIASSFLLRKLKIVDFIKSRSLRLLVPFIVGLILVVPPQAYIQALSNGSISSHYGELSYADFLIRYFTFQGWPSGAFDGAEYGFTWNHLWFIPYLFFYTLALVPLVIVSRSKLSKIKLYRVNKTSLVLVPVLIQIAWQIILNDEKEISHALIDDWYAHAMYGTFFLIGYIISDKPCVWQTISKLRWVSFLGAVLCYCILILLWFKFNQYEWQDHLEGVIATLNQWLWLLAILGWSARLLNHERSWLKHANNCVYPWYILHQTITIVAAYFLAKFSLGGPTEFALVLSITVIGCWLITEHIIRRWKTLKFLFGMK